MADGSPTPRVRDPFGAVGDVGATLLLAAVVLVALLTAAGATGLQPLHSRGVATGLLVGAAALALLAHRLLRRGRGPHAAPAHLLLTTVPALLVVGYALVGRLLPVGARSEWFLGGDHVRHLVMTAETQAAGSLTYDVDSYPRAWHSLLALVWSARGLEPGRDVAALVDTGAVAAWLLSAAVALSTAALAATLAERTGAPERAAAVAGLLAGTATLWPAFLGNYQALGLETSLVAATVLAVVVRAILVDTGPRSLVVAAAGWVALAHTWQLLLPVVGVAALAAAVAVVRRSGSRGALLVVALALGALAASVPPLVAVVTRVGIGHATDADVVSPVPWVVLAAGTVAMLALLRRDRGLLLPALLVVLPAVTGLALAARVGITPATYYPAKCLWHTALLGLAPLAAAVVGLARWLDAHRGRVAGLARVLGGGAVAAGLLYGVVSPAAAYVGGWSTADGPTVLRLVSAPGAGQAQVVWSDGPVLTDTVARILLGAVRVRPPADRTPQEPLTPVAECALLVRAEAPTVLSDRPEAAVRQRYACAPDLRVVPAR